MDDDGLEIVRHKKGSECPPGLHTDVPIIEGTQTVGLVCITCGRSVREHMAYSGYSATPEGKIVYQNVSDFSIRHRKDPRF